MWYVWWLFLLRSMETQFKSFRLLLAPLCVCYGKKEQCFDFFAIWKPLGNASHTLMCVCPCLPVLSMALHFSEHWGMQHIVVQNTNQTKPSKHHHRICVRHSSIHVHSLSLSNAMSLLQTLKQCLSTWIQTRKSFWWINSKSTQNVHLGHCKVRCGVISFSSLWLWFYIETLPTYKDKISWKKTIFNI